ncbi:hypothetical protein NL676_035770 [Syzygium grande]|nr:hypothetical protein NL676_035770 [Syzygium grande]
MGVLRLISRSLWSSSLLHEEHGNCYDLQQSLFDLLSELISCTRDFAAKGQNRSKKKNRMRFMLSLGQDVFHQNILVHSSKACSRTKYRAQ